MIRLHNDRLAIEIQEPGSGYQRARFDWSGICQQVRLDGEHTFCSQEATAEARGTEGVGLTDEFGIQTPVGYDQIESGGWFPKIGIGFLQKVNNDPYNFFYDYNIQPVPFHYEQDRDDQVLFVQESQILNGWGWRLRKTLSLDGNDLAIDYALENCGEKALVTEQYNHNFIAINGETVGPDYQLNTSFPLNLTVINGGVQVDHQYLNLTEIPPTFIYVMQPDGGGLKNTEWRLLHKPSGHGLQVCELFSLQKFAMWGMSHVISPEFFVWIDLQPGQTQTWKRKYTFF